MPLQKIPGTDRSLNFDAAKKTHVGKSLRANGIAGYEWETISVAIAMIESGNLTEFVDVGANIGIYSLVSRAIFGEKIAIHAFEPLPMLSSIIRQLAAVNELGVNVHEIALSDRTGEATFYVSAKADTSNSLNPKFRPSKAEIVVKVETLDDFAARTGLAARLFKIDTESTEPAVLKGGIEYIRKHRPWIICEILHNRTEAKVSSIMKPLGYSFYHIAGAELHAHDVIVGDATNKHRDWLLAPEAPSDAFLASYRRWLDAGMSTINFVE
jgi:FkbM family methyltransferase